MKPPRIEAAPAMLLAGLRQQHDMAGAEASIPEQWRRFRELGLVGSRGGPTYGATAGASRDGFEYLTGVEVESFGGLPDGLGRMRVPAQTYAVFAHEANVSSLGSTWQHIWREWLPGSGYEDAETPPFERYGPEFDAGTGEGGFEIWFPVREARSAPTA